MLIRFWCDSDITFSHGLHKNLVTVLYFSIINVLCRADGDASFAPQVNLVIEQNVQFQVGIYPAKILMKFIINFNMRDI